MTTPRHGFTELPTGQNASPESMNEAVRQLELGANRFVVLDITNTPPGSPVSGDTYIVGTSPTGIWATHANKIANFLSTAWIYITPKEGDIGHPIDEDIDYKYSGAVWAAVPGSALTGEATASQIRTGTSTVTYISPAGVFAASVGVALTSSASITPDFNTGLNFTVTLAHDGQLENPTNAKEGQSGLVKITQDGTGGRTWSYGTNWKFPGGAPVLSTAVGAIDLLAFHVWSGGLITATLTKAYSS